MITTEHQPTKSFNEQWTCLERFRLEKEVNMLKCELKVETIDIIYAMEVLHA